MSDEVKSTEEATQPTPQEKTPAEVATEELMSYIQYLQLRHKVKLAMNFRFVDAAQAGGPEQSDTQPEKAGPPEQDGTPPR